MQHAQLHTLGLIGTGCIGRRIARAAASGEIGYTLAALHDVDADAVERARSEFAPAARVLPPAELMAVCDVVVEAAAAGAVPGILAAARASHAAHSKPGHLLVMSVGGLLGQDLTQAGPVVHVPAGAIGGLEAIQALALAGLDEVHLTTRKPPAGLGVEITEPEVLFDGPACEVVAKFPKNVNVAMALSLAGLGAERTHVTLLADPGIKRNTHHIIARGPAGEIEFTSRNEAFPENPRTSYLAALSAVALLKRLQATLQVG
jgi:aspartate dehydrogenase